MGWRIYCIENTVKVTPECQEELFMTQLYDAVDPDAGGEFWECLEDVVDGDDERMIYFNPDHAEHMNWLTNRHLLNVLLKHKVAGTVKFADLEGGKSPAFWGYSFDGKGNVSMLKCELGWKEKEVIA